MLIFDSHLDIAWNATEWNRNLELEVTEIRASEEGLSGPGRGCNTVSLPELRHGEVGIFIGTFLARRLVKGTPPFAPFETGAAAKAAVERQLEFYRSQVSAGRMRLIETARDLREHCEDWIARPEKTPLGFILSMEGADPILSPEEVPEWSSHGLRIIGPAHYGENRYTHGTSTEGGLKGPGFELLAAMEKENLILDLTHLTDQAFSEALDRFEGPVLASHHNCRELVPGQRQLSDDQITRLLERDAVIGVALDAWMLFAGWERGKSDPSSVGLEAVVDHIDHICQLAGHARQVGIGSDLDGGFGTEQCPHDLDTISDLQKLSPLLEKRGFRTEEVEGIFHGNWIRFFLSALARQGDPEPSEGSGRG